MGRDDELRLLLLLYCSTAPSLSNFTSTFTTSPPPRPYHIAPSIPIAASPNYPIPNILQARAPICFPLVVPCITGTLGIGPHSDPTLPLQELVLAPHDPRSHACDIDHSLPTLNPPSRVIRSTTLFKPTRSQWARACSVRHYGVGWLQHQYLPVECAGPLLTASCWKETAPSRHPSIL